MVGSAEEAEGDEQVRYVGAEMEQAGEADGQGGQRMPTQGGREARRDRQRWTDFPVLREELWLLTHQGHASSSLLPTASGILTVQTKAPRGTNLKTDEHQHKNKTIKEMNILRKWETPTKLDI